MTEATMTIRQMCDQYDVTPRALRFYEAKELLSPIRQGTRRHFTKGDRARLTLILRGKRYGFSLEEIRQLLDLWDGGRGRARQMAEAHEVAARHLAEMEARRAALDEAIGELAAQMDLARAEMDRSAGAAATKSNAA